MFCLRKNKKKNTKGSLLHFIFLRERDIYLTKISEIYKSNRTDNTRKEKLLISSGVTVFGNSKNSFSFII